MSPAPAITGSPPGGGGGGGSTVDVSTTSSGSDEAPSSRLEREINFEDVVVTAKLTAPFPVTSGVTSSESH
jgi:hypothetical protein